MLSIFRYLAVFAFLALPLAACGELKGAKPETPEQSVFAAKLAYSTALAVVEVYADLPLCSDVQPAPCRTQEASDAILKADEAAIATLNLAEQAVRSPTLSDLIKTDTATNALEVVRSFEAMLREFGIGGAT